MTALDTLVQDFETCALPFAEWKHAQHLLVCLWYVDRHGREAATELLRTGIQRYNLAHGVPTTPERGYHETITLFWAWAMADFLSRADRGRPLDALADEMLAAFEDKGHILKYYSRERIMSVEARYGWVDPDLQAF